MTDNTGILHAIENGIELFTVIATGESGMSQIGLARACGKHHTTILNLVKNLVDGKAPKRLERFLGKELTLVDDYVKNGGSVLIYKADFCSAVIKHYARLGSEKAQDIDDAAGEIGLTSYIQGKTGWLPAQYQSSQPARSQINRIMNEPCPYEALYTKEMVAIVSAWFGPSFYWNYFYYWMTAEEKCKLEEKNPPIRGKRKSKIHQWIEPETRARLRDKAIALHHLLRASRSAAHFGELFQNCFGQGWQLALF